MSFISSIGPYPNLWPVPQLFGVQLFAPNFLFNPPNDPPKSYPPSTYENSEKRRGEDNRKKFRKKCKNRKKKRNRVRRLEARLLLYELRLRLPFGEPALAQLIYDYAN